jgi:hypothetical protein
MRLFQSSPLRWRRITLAALSLPWLAVTACTQNLQLGLSNGISVGDPKVFDNRSLSIMLDQLNQQLASVQTINGTTVNGAITNQQGAESHTRSLSVSLAASAVPGAAAAADKANPQPPSPPGAATLPTAPTFTPTFGNSAGDLLSDQVNLSYQIFNIRMLLERALSDRLYEGKTRLQAVVGFQVSIDPPQQATDQAAFVEVTVTSADSGKPPSLVALMPFEKTYNSSTVSSSAVGLGAAVVFQVFSLGVNAQKQDQIFYLLRDTDTMAMEVMQPHDSAPAGSITFGWQFRPVLGRRSVSPGLRQMFAVLAMPDTDEGSKTANFNVQVHTYWRKYNRDLLTTSTTENYARDSRSVPMAVNSSLSYESYLAPVVDNFQWVTAGANTAVVSFTGKNFFPGTQIQVGDKTHSDPSTGLLIKSDISMELTTSLQDLAAGEAFISGRYGKGVTGPTEAKCESSGIAINKISLGQLLGQAEQRLDVELTAREGGNLDFSNCSGIRPLVKFGDTLLPEPYISGLPCNGAPSTKCYRLSTFLKSSLVTGSDLVSVHFPFRGPLWSDALVFSQPSALVIRYAKTTIKGDSKAATKTKVTAKVNAASKTLTTLRISGEPFDENWILILDQDYKVGAGALKLQDGVLFFTVAEDTLAEYKKFFLQPPKTQGQLQPPAIAVDIPPAVAAADKPTLDATKQPAPVARGSASSVTISGKALSLIKQVTFEEENLPFQVSADGTTMTVILSRKVTYKPGSAALILHPASGDFLPVTITVNP